ncbi:MAG TPA: hypothetical protein VGK45_00980, partial [Thermoanaerobaculia bacterium]
MRARSLCATLPLLLGAALAVSGCASAPTGGGDLARTLRSHGLDPAVLTTPDVHKQTQAQLVAVHNLAVDLGIEGTPAFIVG